MKNNFSTYYSNEGSLIWGGFFSSGNKMEKGGVPPLCEVQVSKPSGDIVICVEEYLSPDEVREIVSEEHPSFTEFCWRGKKYGKKMAGGGKMDDFGGSEKRSNFTINTTKDEIRNVISGKSEVSNGESIQTASIYLRRNEGTSSSVTEPKLLKQQQEAILRDYSEIIPISDFKIQIGEGTEHRVYGYDEKTVIKINSCYFYNSWQDYFHSLLLHNYFFPDTAYELIGFTEENGKLFSVVKQAFVEATEATDLGRVRKFLLDNGFVNTRNDDYFNEKIGVILEDLHEQNVIINNEFIYFVDTVFYIKNPDTRLAGGGDVDFDEYIRKAKARQEVHEKYLQNLYSSASSRPSYEVVSEHATREEAESVAGEDEFTKEKPNGMWQVLRRRSIMAGGGKAGIPERYKNMGFSNVGQKKKSTRPEKKWMVLAKKGNKYRVVHGGQKGMKDFSQHHDKDRQKRFWHRMGGFDSEKASDPFSPLYWHKKFGTWEEGGELDTWLDHNEMAGGGSVGLDILDKKRKRLADDKYLSMHFKGISKQDMKDYLKKGDTVYFHFFNTPAIHGTRINFQFFNEYTHSGIIGITKLYDYIENIQRTTQEEYNKVSEERQSKDYDTYSIT